MNEDEEPVCRLCLKICDSFEIIKDATKSVLNSLLLTLDLSISHEPVMCSGCTDDLKKCFEFKAACLHKRNLIINMAKDIKFHPSVVYLKENTTLVVESFTSGTVCCICAEQMDSSTLLRNEETLLHSVLEIYLPEIELKFEEDTLVCNPCHNSLQEHMTFINKCLDTEKEVKEYCELAGSNNEGQIDLKDVLRFFFEDKGCFNTNSILNVVKSEEKREQVDDKSIVGVDSTEFVTGEEIQLLSTEDDAIIKREPTNEDRIDLTTSSPTQSESTLVETDEELVYKCKKCPYFTGFKGLLQEHMRSHQKIRKIVRTYKCEVCSYVNGVRENILRHSLLHKTPSTTYKCEECSFLTLSKKGLKMHMRTHSTLSKKRSSKVKVYKCDVCSFESNYKHMLIRHLREHKSHPVIYKCEQCPFETLNFTKRSNHIHTHRSYFEPGAKLEIRTYQRKHKSELQKHDDAQKKFSSNDEQA